MRIGCENPLVRSIFEEADARGLRTSDLARMVAIHPNSVTNWRNGHTKISLVDTIMLAGAIGLELKIGAMAV